VNERSVREALSAERAEILGRIRALHRSLEDIVSASLSANVDDEHEPEGATIAFERAQVAALLARAEQHLEESTDAPRRLDACSYGRCEVCDGTIASERLLARPTARTCVHAAAATRA